MIKIGNTILKKQPKFWNHALFHPTDAIEDAWGRRILDRMAEDGSIGAIRLYAMLEDIVYTDEKGRLCYDFRLNDLRLDYLLEKGFEPLIAYAAMPDCIAISKITNGASKNATRYKGKHFNTSPPKDYALWEEVCYEYTRHLVERYGEERVATWHCHCFNEPDGVFWRNDLRWNDYVPKCEEYCKLYDAFVRGVRRASPGIRVGGPALAEQHGFLDIFLSHVKETGTELNYIAVHTYGTGVSLINNGSRPIATENHFTVALCEYMEIIRKHGFEKTEFIIDEWGASAQGYYNMEECPGLIFREHEVYASYFARLIYQLIEADYPISKMMICLSGQHEMTKDFSGFRNFFTLNFIAKPIYNAHLMTTKMKDYLVDVSCNRADVYAVPTKDDGNNYAVLLTYCSRHFTEDIPTITETITFADTIADKTVTVYCIDKEHTNPYRMWERLGTPEMTEEVLTALREEGQLKPHHVQKGSAPITLTFTPNATYLITAEDQ